MKLNYKRTFLVGFAFLAICAFWQLYDNIVPLILKYTFDMGETVSGVVMAADNVVALIMLPLFGALSDKVNTRFGKRTPFIVVGTVISVAIMMIMPVADNNKNLFLFIASLAIVLLSMCSYRSPAVALMPDLTPKPLRSKANAVINLMGALGGVYTLGMIMVLVPKSSEDISPDYIPLFISVGALMLVSAAVVIFIVKEKKVSTEVEAFNRQLDIAEATNNKTKEAQKVSGTENRLSKDVLKSLIFILSSVFLWFTAYNAVTTAFSRYAVEVWKLENGGFANCLMIATGAAVISYIPIGFISSRFGRKKTIIAGIILMTLSYLCGAFCSEYSFFVNIIFVFTGFGWAAINVNSYPMVVEMSKSSNIGKYTGYYYTFSMAAQVATPILSGFLLEHIGYRTLFPYAVVFSLASLCTMLFVKHGDAKPVKKDSVLEHYDVED